MPPQGGQPRTFSKGDIVWVHIKGLPWWPGQVMDPAQATEKMKAHQKPNTHPINTFGDDQFTWALPRAMIPFQEGLENHSQQRISSKFLKDTFKVAMEEAIQMLDVRAGRSPTTEHHLMDFLQPPVAEPAQPSKALYGYEPPQAFDADDPKAQDVNVEAAVAMLKSLAIHPEQGVDKDDDIVRLLFTWRALVYSEPEDLLGKRKRKKREISVPKSPQPVSEPPLSKSTQKVSTGTKRKAAKREATPPAATEEDEEEEKPESEAEISDVEPEQEASSESEGDEEGAEAAEAEEEEDEDQEEKDAGRKVKKRRKLAVPVQLTAENQWQAVETCDAGSLLNFLKSLAIADTSPVDDLRKVEACSHLLREQTFLRSIWKREGFLGPFAQDASQAYLDSQATTQPSPKGKKKTAAGIPCAKPKLGMTAVSKDYKDRIPADTAGFGRLLEEFYSKHEKTVTPPIIDGTLLDLEKVFRAVAERGGYEAVTLNKLWPSIGRAWREDVSRNGLSLMHKKYCQHLLAFELDLSKGAPETTVYPTSKAEKKDKKGLRAEQIAKRIKDNSLKRQQVSRKALDHGRAVQEKSTGNRPDAAAAAKKPLLEVDPFADIESEEDEEPYMRKAKKTVSTSASPSASKQKLQARIQKGNMKRKSDLSNDAFKSLAADKTDFATEVEATGAARGSQETDSASLKPLAERKLVLRIKFAQGIEMPSRQRILVELRKYGAVEDVQLLNKQNSYLFRFSKEQSATNAFAALDRKASRIWNLPKDSINVFQEQQAKHKPPAKPQPSVAASSKIPVFKPVPAPTAANGQQASKKPDISGQPLRSIMKKAAPEETAIKPEILGKPNLDPRQMAGIPRGVHPSAPRPVAPAAAIPRSQGVGVSDIRSGLASSGVATDPRQQVPAPAPAPAQPSRPVDPRQGLQVVDPRQDPRQAPHTQNLDPRQMRPAAPQLDPRQAPAGPLPVGPQPQFFMPGPQMQQGPPPQSFQPGFQPGFQNLQGPPPPYGNPGMQDARQIHRADNQYSLPMGPFPNLPYGQPFVPQPQAPSQLQHPAPPENDSNKDTAMELTMKMSNMDHGELMRILQNIQDLPKIGNQNQSSQPQNPSGASTALPSLDSLLSGAGIQPLRDVPSSGQGPFAGPQHSQQNECTNLNPPALAGEGNQMQSTDISGQLFEVLSAFGGHQ